MNLFFFLKLWVLIKIISAIFRIYQRNSNYIGDFLNISAQLDLYQRLLRYIDLSTKSDNKKEAAPINMMEQPPIFMLLYSFSVLFFL
ncbi:hypothetical protein COA08_18280 [Bacillus cereus]|uniref:Uncharacterized protein n=1 Tax=Bacillus cereus TaxID=1396 RepID=A0A2B8T7D7_BACCE|nr:hypothetical protein CON06_01190 [Bacillus cereus]PFA04326.1 hypothetical protein CN382_27985 [Bacillus cereus]PFM34921.1 hypothetical protein COJ43_24060 [Bacillus cereus]PGL65517.1 hypothetical protein CN927_00050 [Bacillus cereus]PGQ07699.1 hypothetical protein COA08_18280 [Bacillus cereus]